MTYFSSSLQAGTDAKPVSSGMSFQDEISSEVALDTLAEIARNHIVAKRVMLLRTAEKQHERAGLTAPGKHRLTQNGLDFLPITEAEFQFRTVV
jgi:hypothetical protein